jgi:hypothetical protein
LAAHSGCFEEEDAVLFTGVAESTIKRMEQDEGFPVARGATIEAVYKTLAGIIFCAGKRRRRRYSTPQVYKTSAKVWVILSRGNQPSWIACRVMENAPGMMDWLAITVATVAIATVSPHYSAR